MYGSQTTFSFPPLCALRCMCSQFRAVCCVFTTSFHTILLYNNTHTTNGLDLRAMRLPNNHQAHKLFPRTRARLLSLQSACMRVMFCLPKEKSTESDYLLRTQTTRTPIAAVAKQSAFQNVCRAYAGCQCCIHVRYGTFEITISGSVQKYKLACSQACAHERATYNNVAITI